MRIKHNKKRNTAFLYESLIRELTKTILKKNVSRKKKVLSIIKEFFIMDTTLKAELGLYKTLVEERDHDPATAERILWEVKTDYGDRLNKSRIFKEQSALIKKINTLLSQDVYSNFVPNYKQLASVHAVFNIDLPPKERVILERSIIENITLDSASTQKREAIKEPIDNIVYKSFVKKFNEMYGDTLLKEQKELMSRYIISFQDNSIGLKIFLNEEMTRLREVLTTGRSTKEFLEDTEMTSKMTNVLNILESFKEKTIDKGLVEDVLKIQQLAYEMTSG
jgi:hypothetical protein